MKQSMFNHWIQNKGFAIIPTHYIVWYTGDMVKVNDEELIVWAVWKDKYNTTEQVIEANRKWIHIEIVWDFNISKPSEEQYIQVAKLVIDIQSRHTWIQIRWHKDFASKNCPWVNFDFEYLNRVIERLKQPEYEIYNASRYYSPEQNQTAYFRWSYIEDVKMNCWLNKDWSPWDCSHTANGHKLQPNEVWYIWACPKEYKGRRIQIDRGYWKQNFYCADVGSAITAKRIDIWCWYGQIWYDNIKQNKCTGQGEIKVYLN